jgi:hypothetical protein
MVGFAAFSLVGVWFILFPGSVLRFYSWFHGPDFDRLGTTTQQVRNAGLLWLLLMAFAAWANQE